MKPLTLLQTQFDAILEDFQKYLKDTDLESSNLEYNTPWSRFISKPDTLEKINIFYTVEAHAKIKALVNACSDEIGWHGTVRKIEEGFLVYDIFTYPQVVTGATIVCDADAYAMWNMQLEDEVINHTRLHGHSHVNMGVTPSGLDMSIRQDLITKLDKDDYYIFMITNKSNAVTHHIYDLEKNIMYENGDIVVHILMEEGRQEDWVAEQMKNVTKKTAAINQPTLYTPPTTVKPTELPIWQKRATLEYNAKMKRWVVTSPYGNKAYYTSKPEGEFITI